MLDSFCAHSHSVLQDSRIFDYCINFTSCFSVCISLCLSSFLSEYNLLHLVKRFVYENYRTIILISPEANIMLTFLSAFP